MSLPPLQLQTLDVSSPLPPGLRNGDLLAAKVSRIETDGALSLQFGGWRALSQPVPGLRLGDFVFAVVQKKPDAAARIAVLAGLKTGGTVTGKVMSSHGLEVLLQVDDVQLRARLQNGRTQPEPGSLVQGRLWMHSGRPVIEIASSNAPDASAALLDAPLATSVGDNLSSQDPAAVSLRGLTDSADTLKALGQYPSLQKLLESVLALLQGLSKNSLSQFPSLDWLSKILAGGKLNPAADDLAAQLASAVRESGIFLESRLLHSTNQDGPSINNDLKCALLQSVQELTSAVESGSKLPFLQEATEKILQLLHMVRSEQLFNASLASSGRLYLQLPLGATSGLYGFEMLISPQKEQRNKTVIDFKNVILTIAVSTSRLGRIRAGIFIMRGRMTCQFKASRRWVADLIEKNADVLRQSLERLDIPVMHIGCTTISEERDLSILAEFQPQSQKGFDARV